MEFLTDQGCLEHGAPGADPLPGAADALPTGILVLQGKIAQERGDHEFAIRKFALALQRTGSHPSRREALHRLACSLDQTERTRQRRGPVR